MKSYILQMETVENSNPLQIDIKFENMCIGEDNNTKDKIYIKKNILRGIFKYGFLKPSPIQKKGIPLILSRKDLIAQSQAGTGKTATFAIAVLQMINETIKSCQAIILAPTRELAQQIHIVLTSLGKYTKIKTELCVGGTNINESRYRLKNGIHIVIGTPGRIIDIIERCYIITKFIKILIVDEADELLRGTFIDQMKSMIQCIPTQTQICLFSATMPKRALEITQDFLVNPAMILVEKEKLSLSGIKQFYIDVERELWKFNTLCDIYERISINQAIIYVNTKEKAIKLSEDLIGDNFTVSVMHSRMTPIERTNVMNNFRKGNTRILVSTDLLARGIDIKEVSIVVNYDIPMNTEHYLHRIGRSGRFGRKGVAINFITRNDYEMLKHLEDYYRIKIKEMPKNIAQFL